MRDVMATRWSDIGSRIIGLAESFPEESYDFRPVPEVRSFAEQLRHVAFWNDYLRDLLRGVAADGAANELPADAYPAKAEIVPALRESFDEVRAELASASRKGMNDSRVMDSVVSFIEHGGEHYGQLVVYARLCGVVPPASLAAV